MLATMATNDTRQTLIAYVKTRLTSKALEALKPDDDTIVKIIASLRSRIKPDTSTVVMGRLSALRLARKSVQDFAKEAEELAEGLKRALVFEGFPENKAQELTVEKTVSVCRESSNSDIVKSVLAAAQFATPSEVLSKFITETDKNRVEKQVLAVRQFNKQKFMNRGRNPRGNFQPRNRGQYHQNNNRNGYNQYNNNYGNNSYRNNNNGYGNRGNRGRGNGQGQYYNNGQQNGRRQYYGNNQRNINVAENYQDPQRQGMGANEQEI